MYLTLPNLLSFIRIPLAFLFLQNNPSWRIFAITTAMLTDGLDGYLARNHRMGSKLGILLDPLADKFFVIFAAIIFIKEGQLQPWQTTTLLCRDLSVLIFGFYLLLSGKLMNYQYRSIWCGKVTTVLQFFVLMALSLQVQIPDPLYITFILLGILSLVELAVPKKARN